MVTSLNITALVVGILLTNTITSVFSTEKVRHYHGYKVIRASPKTPAQYQAIYELILSDKYDIWRAPFQNNGPCDVMVSPSEFTDVTSFLSTHKIDYHVMIPNVEAIIKQERLRKQSHSRTDMDWEEYHSYDEVNTWLSNLVAGSINGSSTMVTSEKYGSSYEGRDLLVYKVSNAGGNRTKVAFWIDATIHAREHITTAVITYMINELVTNSTKYADILEQVDFYFAPFLNPDGYVYSNEVDRMWRKTRSVLENTTCVGVDANRNYGFEWGDPNGASANPCNSGYHGPEPFSEPETRSMADYILAKAQNQNVSWEAYITLHSYSQLWLSPWGYTRVPPEDHQEVLQVAKDAVAELKSYFNTSYVIGNSGDALYLTSGSSQDWAKGGGGFKFVYTVELRDQGQYGFLLPPEQIMDTSVETWAGVQVVAREMISRRKTLF